MNTGHTSSSPPGFTNVATFCVHGGRLADPDQDRLAQKFIMLSPPPTSWRQDSDGRLILFGLPSSIDVSPETKPGGRLASLPSDIHYLILDHLHPIDRVCLGLTNKTLCLSVLTAPALKPSTWAKFGSSSHPCNYYPKQGQMPEIYALVLRLAHGWVDKSQYRYCWKCHRILTRSEEVWRNRLPESRPSVKIRFNVPLPGRKTIKEGLPPSALDDGKRKLRLPKWSIKTCVDQQTWEGWDRTERYDHLVKTWCYSPNEDSSCLYCDHCRAHNPKGILDGACGSAMGSGAIHPVECPSCLERELTWVWMRQSRQQVDVFGRRKGTWWRRCKDVVEIVGSLVRRPWKIPVWIFRLAWFAGLCLTRLFVGWQVQLLSGVER